MSIDNNENTDPNNEEGPAVVDPCEELPPPPVDPPPGTGGETPADPDNTAIQLPPFLAPLNVVDEEIRSSSREVNVFNKRFFMDLSQTPPTLADSSPGTAQDKIRLYFGMLWGWNNTKEIFLKNERTNNTPIKYEIIREEYSTTRKSWNSFVDVSFEKGNYDNFWSQAMSGLSPRGIVNEENNTTRYPYIYDNVFAAAQPFYSSELDNIRISDATSVSISSHVGYYEDKPHVPEVELPNLYRAYFRAGRNVHENCNVDDRTQKFSSDSVAEMKTANESMKRYFNQYVEISITTQQGGKIASLLDEFQMDKYVLELASSNYTRPVSYSQVEDESRFTSSENDQALENDRFLLNALSRTSPDPFTSLISTIKNRGSSFFEGLNHSSYPLKYEYWNNSELLRFTDTIRSQLFMNNLEQQVLIPRNIRSLKNIYDGRKSFSEIIGYRIAKHEVVDGEMSTAPIQNFYIMDSDKVLTIDFVDSQVNPGKTYVYRIHSLNLVIGSKYAYIPESELIDAGERITSKYKVEVLPSVKLIEAPFFQKVVSIVEKPPMAPQVSFIPLQGEDSAMQMLIQSNFGEKKEIPLKIFPEDQEIINSMLESQQVSEEGIMQYQTDSLPEKFQIMRLSTPPETYQDFVDSDYVQTVDVSSRALIFNDEQFEPNKNYYYAFRAIDKVGISNPTEVYKVKVNSYVNGIFLDIKQYEMVPLHETKPTMTFERALKIEPAFQQRAVTFSDNIPDLDSRDFAMSVPSRENIVFGETSEEDSVWGRDFKVRLKSKRTGRQIDLNMKFTKKIINIAPADPPTASENTPCGSTELDIAIGNDGGVSITNPTEIIGPDPQEPLPLDPQPPFDPESPGLAEAQRVLEIEAIGDRVLEMAGVASADEFAAGQDIEGFVNASLEGVGTSAGAGTPSGAAVGVGSTTDGQGSYTTPTSESMQSGMAGGGDDDDRSGNAGSSGGDGVVDIGGDVFLDGLGGSGNAGSTGNNTANLPNAGTAQAAVVQATANVVVTAAGAGYGSSSGNTPPRPPR
tara:strand:+ start:2062 stop:5133 length:3072 start_codon:yes stop_codon:yes gene_type:complete